MKVEFHATLKKAIECMGIQELKSKQIESIESFVSGRILLFPCRLDMGLSYL